MLGERLWVNRDQVPIPVKHRKVPNILSAVSGIGMVLIIWGVLFLNIWPILLVAAVIYLSKLLFLDRMVWLFSDMNREDDKEMIKG